MKKTTSDMNQIIVIFVVMICIPLMGCTEPVQHQQKTYAEMIDYEIFTYWETGCSCDNTLEIHTEPGFHHHISVWDPQHYNISGSFQTTPSSPMPTLQLNTLFYDENDVLLFDAAMINLSITYTNLTPSQVHNFSFKMYPRNIDYLYQENTTAIELYEAFHMVESVSFQFQLM